jgi:hypothetical protein
MRRLRIFEHISLDGVIQHSADENDFPYSDRTAPYRTPAGRDVVTLDAPSGSPSVSCCVTSRLAWGSACKFCVCMAMVLIRKMGRP